MKYRIQEPGTAISGFADGKRKGKKIIPTDTLDFVDMWQ